MGEGNVDADVLIAGGVCCWSSEKVDVVDLIWMVVYLSDFICCVDGRN